MLSIQRLQRFSTYGHLKQIVLKLIVEGDLLLDVTGMQKSALQAIQDSAKPSGS